MHQITFLTTPDGQKYLFLEHFSGGLEVCENASKRIFNHYRLSKLTFLRTWFWCFGSMRKCIKTRFEPLQTFKYIFFKNIFLVVWMYAKMHQNTFLTTPDVQKYLFWKKVYGGLEVWANASKHVFNHSRRSKISFLKKSFWWSGSMRKCIKTTPDSKKYIFSEHISGGLKVCANAPKHVFNHSRQWKISLLRTWFWWSGSIRKCTKKRF